MSEPGFTGLGDYRDSFLYIKNRGNHKIPLILVLTVFTSLLPQNKEIRENYEYVKKVLDRIL